MMCFANARRLCHWGPIVALVGINGVTAVTIYINGVWWPLSTPGSILNIFGLMSLAALVMFNYLAACFSGPGYLPLHWKPKNEEDGQYLQFCQICQGYKAPRSHHCRKCGRCVMKMDHHCPWINNCVGWGNHAHFTAFLMFMVVGAIHATVILYLAVYKTFYSNLNHYVLRGPIAQIGLYGVIATIFSLGLTTGVILAVGGLLLYQIRAIIRNRTGIEDWILEKALSRRKGTNSTFIYPYDLGFRSNIKQVINLRCDPVGDGINWPVADGCTPYTLTIEQLDQKNEKRQRSKLHTIVKAASGSWFPITHGVKVFFCMPLNDEPRIRLECGDTVLVTRWRRHWLFGEKIQSSLPEGQQAIARIRGWFPRRCAGELVEEVSDIDAERSHQKKLD